MFRLSVGIVLTTWSLKAYERRFVGLNLSSLSFADQGCFINVQFFRSGQNLTECDY